MDGEGPSAECLGCLEFVGQAAYAWVRLRGGHSVIRVVCARADGDRGLGCCLVTGVPRRQGIARLQICLRFNPMRPMSAT